MGQPSPGPRRPTSPASGEVATAMPAHRARRPASVRPASGPPVARVSKSASMRAWEVAAVPVELAVRAAGGGPADVAVHHLVAEDQAEELAARLRERMPRPSQPAAAVFPPLAGSVAYAHSAAARTSGASSSQPRI